MVTSHSYDAVIVLELPVKQSQHTFWTCSTRPAVVNVFLVAPVVKRKNSIDTRFAVF